MASIIGYDRCSNKNKEMWRETTEPGDILLGTLCLLQPNQKFP